MSSEHKENHPPEFPLKPLPNSQDTDDEQTQRGRKRRRSSANSPPALNPSVGNNFRGRGRRRSLSAISSNSAAATPRPRSSSPPGRKYQKRKDGLIKGDQKEKSEKGRAVEKRRSQSPSRSRSRGVVGTPVRRRRQRTRTRSRSHDGMKKGNSKVEATITGVEAKETQK